jgi:peptidoglycan hydrolase-like amidase
MTAAWIQVRKLGSFLRWRLLFGFILLAQVSLSDEPTVRIGIHRNVEAFTLDSAEPFQIEGRTVRSARFTTVMTLGATGDVIRTEDIERRMAIEVGDDTVLVRLMGEEIDIEAGPSPFRVNGSAYRGAIDVLSGEDRFTVVNELELEAYLLGVVPNELWPGVFPQMEALKAQAVAARTYIIRNLGQFEAQGFDICATDQCQVYRGLDSEHPMSTQAIEETRGLIATYDGEPIQAFYSSTCGGRTENSENVFGQAIPYLVSTICHYEHSEPEPFSSSVQYANWEAGLLEIAGVETFNDAGLFMGLGNVGEPEQGDIESLSAFVRSRFFPDVVVGSDRRFLEEQGILTPDGDNEVQDVLVRLLLGKDVFEWQDARLMAWDGEVLRLRVTSTIQEFRIRPDAAIFNRVGDVRLPVDQGAWIGGESMEIRLVPGTEADAFPEIEALVYRSSPSESSADRYSPVASWQLHQTREELDRAFFSLGIGLLEDIAVLERGPSNRVVRARIQGSLDAIEIRGPRLRTLLGIRDSMVYMDEERNRDGDLLGMSFFGKGWGHGVGLCQVGAYGMAIDGATAEDILTAYYQGIELERAF